LSHDRAWPELENTPLLIEDVDAGDIAREEIRRELNSFEGASNGPGNRLSQYRLPHAWHVFDQYMSMAQKRHEHQVDIMTFTNDDTFDIVARRSGYGLDGAQIHRRLQLLAA
jgi:hypothetical protein